jgi:hypothetical protein
MKRFASVATVLAAVAAVAVATGVAASPAAAQACPVPVLDGFNFTSLIAATVPCPEARELALHIVRPRMIAPPPADWSCTTTFSGGNLSYACIDRLIASRRVDFTFNVL